MDRNTVSVSNQWVSIVEMCNMKLADWWKSCTGCHVAILARFVGHGVGWQSGSLEMAVSVRQQPDQ